MSILALHAPVGRAEVNPRKGVFARFIETIQRSRQIEAERIVAQYRHLLPQELERAGNRLSARNEDLLPFID